MDLLKDYKQCLARNEMKKGRATEWFRLNRSAKSICSAWNTLCIHLDWLEITFDTVCRVQKVNLELQEWQT